MEGFDLRGCVDYVMEKRWKDYRYELHQYYKQFKSTEEARQHPYGNVTQEDWDWLCTFFDSKYSEVHIFNVDDPSDCAYMLTS